MVESLIEWSIRNRFLVIAAALAVGLAGLRAILTMPVDAIPDQSENQVIVFADWKGRSPQEIEDQVTYPLASRLQGLAGVKVVRSSSEFNFSMVSIIFRDDIDYYFARQRVLERLTTIAPEMPEGVTPYLAPDATAVGQIFWYTVEGDGYDLGELRAIQDWYVRYGLNSVPGVAEVAGVGGSPREYQIDIDPNVLRAYRITLGELFSAVSRSNSAVGGRVIHKGNAEYIVRSVGWIRGVEDIENTVVAERDGVPIDVKTVATVQLGPAFKRSVLEKDGREVVGGVVLMRVGENPLEVTRRVKEKISSLSKGLPPGVKIVPFYDRTPLIHDALETVFGTVREELVICSLAIILVMGHLGGALIVSLAIPLSILTSFLLMQIFGISSNIMSLSGIAITIGILADQAIVMTDNAAHHLSRKFGREPVRGDNLEVVISACRTLGRPIFFSVLITLLSFLPVFALSGRSGKLFHPLAWTKTFALVGAGVLSVTFVPALIPVFLKGRIKSEQDNWLVRSMTAIYRPMLSALLGRPGLVMWLFLCILGFGYLASSRLGREFVPPLDEGSILDMPLSVPRMSVTQATRDLKARDAVLRSFPEVKQVVGKAGRAETPTDPSPLDMVETIVNLWERPLWPKRKLRFEDTLEQTQAAFNALRSKGFVKSAPTADEQSAFLNDVAMSVDAGVNDRLRTLARSRLREYQPEVVRKVAESALGQLLNHVGVPMDSGSGGENGDWLRVFEVPVPVFSGAGADPSLVLREPSADERREITNKLMQEFGDALWPEPRLDVVSSLVQDAAEQLAEKGVVKDDPHLLASRPGPWRQTWNSVSSLLGLPPETWLMELTEHLVEVQHDEMEGRMKSLNWELFDTAVASATSLALNGLVGQARENGQLVQEPSPNERKTLQAALQKTFADRVFLWQKSKADLVSEMDSTLQVPGWGNVFTQPIINRIEMLATGVRTPIAVKVFGSDLDEIQSIAQEIAQVIRSVPGAGGVIPDQIIGKGYVEITINREQAARYGVNVGDIQDVVEVAIGGKSLTTTVEGRRRFPVRIRYARDFRSSEEDLKRLLVSARGATAMGPKSAPSGPLQIPLSEVADVKVVEGPSVIKSENGLLRAYVSITTTGRDEVGFVEEAARAVSREVKLPPGMYIEWTGQFENEVKTRKTLSLVFPAVIAVIAVILYLTYKSWTDALLMMTSVLGALAGGAIFQWLFGFPFSVAVWVGYIACFGMATETSVVMLVYLREAIEERGGLEQIPSLAELRQAILDGAVHRLRPKLLTEGTTILSIAPMLWASGVGAEIIRPMAAPVLGGLLIADEVIDVFLPVLYFNVQSRRWRKLHPSA